MKNRLITFLVVISTIFGFVAPSVFIDKALSTPKYQKWDYFFIKTPYMFDPEEDIEFWRKQGQLGWEFAGSINPNHGSSWLVFKRPKN